MYNEVPNTVDIEYTDGTKEQILCQKGMRVTDIQEIILRRTGAMEIDMEIKEMMANPVVGPVRTWPHGSRARLLLPGAAVLALCQAVVALHPCTVSRLPNVSPRRDGCTGSRCASAPCERLAAGCLCGGGSFIVLVFCNLFIFS